MPFIRSPITTQGEVKVSLKSFGGKLVIVQGENSQITVTSGSNISVNNDSPEYIEIYAARSVMVSGNNNISIGGSIIGTTICTGDNLERQYVLAIIMKLTKR